jgi:hypothetical protein
MQTWKKIILWAVGVGAGFAVMAGLIVGAFLWWSHRPIKPKPWNTNAITASFDAMDAEGEKNNIEFVYTLQNNTDADYEVTADSSIHLGATLRRSKAFSFDNTKFLKSDLPIYIPAKSRVRYKLHLDMPYSVKEDFNASDDVRHNWETALCQYADKEFSNLSGFALLDDNSRYQINMPNGWSERAKEPLRVKSAEVKNPK